MKILFYNHTGRVSGAEHVLLMIIQGLDRSRIEPVLLCPNEGTLTNLTPAGIRKIPIDPLSARFTSRPDHLWRYVKSSFQVIRAARAAVICEAPDIIHANSIRSGLVMSVATFGCRIPIIWHAHDMLPRHPLSTAVRLLALMSNRNCILSVSRAVADRFRGKVLDPFARRVRHEVIHNGVNAERFYPDPETRATVRRDLGINDTQLVIGTVGQLTPRKGQLELIKAFAEIAGEFSNAVLLIIGAAIFNRDEEYAARLARTAASLGLADRIRFLGQREDVARLIRGLDCLVVNSKSEPFGLAVVEGLASEIPVLATAVDGIPEIIRHGENGWLVPPDDLQKLADSLRQLLQDPELRRRLGRQGRRDMIADFTTQRFLTDIHSLYWSLSQSRELPQRKASKSLMAKPITY